VTTFQWIESVGTLVTVLAALGALGYFRALNILVQAQLHPNHGGSLLDLVRLIPLLRKAVDDLRELVVANHEEGKQEWAGLHDEDGELVRRMDRFDQIVKDFQRALEPRLQLQDHTVGRVDAMETRQTAFDARLQVLETKAHEH